MQGHNNKYGKWTWLAIALLGTGRLCAQETIIQKKDYLKDYVFKGNHLQFNFAGLSTFKAQLKKQTGDYPVKSTATPGILLSFKYSRNFNNNYSLITGPEAIILGRNFNATFYKDDFSPPLIADYNLRGLRSYFADLTLCLPVVVERRWLYASRKFLFADAGLRLSFSLGADIEGFSVTLQNTANGFYTVADVTVTANNDAKPWLSFPLNLGHSWLLKNNNLLQLSICSNISFTKYVNGNYTIDVPNKPITGGNYSSTGTYIGLSFNYVFTSANYRIRKAYEKIKESR